MRQAVANLIENAALHSRPGGGIRISGQASADVLHLTIEDDGPGVDSDELPYIFNPFYRARNGLALPNGTGLGLAIVKGFVTLCGGKIRAQSSPATTRFVIELPLAQPGTV
jgi:two-component system sensor histidine kinase KdpD